MSKKRNYHYLYRRWTSIRQMLLNPQDPHYARCQGVTCTSLDNFTEFKAWVLADIGDQPTKKHRLNRCDIRQGWHPGNVRWALQREVCQNREREFHRLVTYQGETRCLSDWCQRLNVDYMLALGRHDRNWPAELMFTVPASHGNRIGRLQSDQC